MVWMVPTSHRGLALLPPGMGTGQRQPGQVPACIWEAEMPPGWGFPSKKARSYRDVPCIGVGWRRETRCPSAGTGSSKHTLAVFNFCQNIPVRLLAIRTEMLEPYSKATFGSETLRIFREWQPNQYPAPGPTHPKPPFQPRFPSQTLLIHVPMPTKAEEALCNTVLGTPMAGKRRQGHGND